ncbi:hypothetical protein AB0G54_19195 [Streptomyces yokosukanensis]|uniref:hypothetical protein n=1 Tax=Streptomyces yokosukanensis TaxID=67386 RepID=UPI000B1C9BBA|nr:hypothetical protein [Streptomyces yokosukanensis]
MSAYNEEYGRTITTTAADLGRSVETSFDADAAPLPHLLSTTLSVILVFPGAAA